jgi:hypothetical protein
MATNTNHYPTINDLPVLDPEPLYASARAHGHLVDFWGKANSITIPVGRLPGRAYFVVPKTTYSGLDLESRMNLKWKYGDDTLVQSNWVVTKATAIGSDLDDNAAYFLELADKRWVLARHGGTVNVSYNQSMLFPQRENATKVYWSDSLNGSTAYTWQEILEELWAQLPAGLAGSCPTLAWYPAHTPENWAFRGESAWSAIFRLLDACQCTLAPTASGFDCIGLGDEQTAVDTLSATHAAKLLLDAKPSPWIAESWVPELVGVFFAARTQERPGNVVPSMGVEHSGCVSYEVETYDADAEPDTCLAVWSDFAAEIGADETVLNDSALAAAARDLTERITLRLQRCSLPMLRHFSGYINGFALGAQLHRITYRDYGDDAGFRTEISADTALAAPGQCAPSIRTPWPGDMIATTPAGGITGRSGSTVYGEWCNISWIGRGATDTERPVADLDDYDGDRLRLLIFQLLPGDVTGSAEIIIGCTEDGTLYSLGEACTE